MLRDGCHRSSENGRGKRSYRTKRIKKAPIEKRTVRKRDRMLNLDKRGCRIESAKNSTDKSTDIEPNRDTKQDKMEQRVSKWQKDCLSKEWHELKNNINLNTSAARRAKVDITQQQPIHTNNFTGFLQLRSMKLYLIEINNTRQ
ncbi:hypothetical protein PoB_006601800 [Plakobranchus ocellatus]|uniref:Uncharacterized protein n=1 Tax=Plakobranchus ocellatus TaxID=259542 RepID=A0AAV4D5U8_9GAST|nr:hypothetical protein PoB_006601800 [Plakobranchus ocellatus]